MKDPIRIGNTIVYDPSLIHWIEVSGSSEPESEYIVKLGTHEEVRISAATFTRIMGFMDLKQISGRLWNNPSANLYVMGLELASPDFRLEDLIGLIESDRHTGVLLRQGLFLDRRKEGIYKLAAEVYLKRYRAKLIN